MVYYYNYNDAHAFRIRGIISNTLLLGLFALVLFFIPIIKPVAYYYDNIMMYKICFIITSSILL